VPNFPKSHQSSQVIGGRADENQSDGMARTDQIVINVGPFEYSLISYACDGDACVVATGRPRL